ncbi:FMN-binding protein [Microbacterium sp.]|uniref:FMN-binding protein n=1 Tax=Microbacterium sp. TaxID=51671 RepID=UPI00333FDBA5
MTSRTARSATALVGVAGALLLAGCSGAATAESTPGGTAPSGSGTGSAGYKDGTYTAEGSYQTPETVEKISVTLTLKDGSVTDVEVTGDPQARETERYQGQFIDGIAAVVDGKRIDELKVDRVAGSSLTSGGFNRALELIKEQAAA